MIQIKYKEHIFTYKGNITLDIDSYFIIIWFNGKYEGKDFRGVDFFYIEDIEWIIGK